MRRFVVFIAVALAAVVGPAPLVSADSGHPKNSVSVQNTVDGAMRIKAKTKIAEDQGPTIAPENSAFAYASCTDCLTIAVAVQVVLVIGTVHDARPSNAAVAMNYQCLRCHTFAYANQVLIPVDHEVELSDEARERVANLREQIAATAASSDTFDQMSSDLNALTQQLVDVITNDIHRTQTSTGEETHQRDEREAA
jgi:putative peptide zinc metalloprotease protein